MILDFKNDLELEGEDIGTSTEASISAANLPFIIDLITRQQYRDPIGSIIREITSNCFDAHIEAGVELPVTIDFNQDSLGKYISFKDQGIGMSPDRIKNVYLSYGESTKRLNNQSIGGFGLGGKSPLSYTDSFYVTTIFDKIKYEYIVHKGKTLPKIELIEQSHTTKRNGTEVKIYFNEPDDYWTFIDKAKKQLVYFDNVVFNQTWLFNNDYKIIEGKNFKCRIDTGKDSTKYNDYIHLCIGKVPYPIDYNLIDRDTIKIPIALKFEIGELIVTPDRESIRYVEIDGKSTEDIIRNKLDLAIEELKQLYNKQDSLKVDSLITYLERRAESPELNIHGLDLNLKPIIKESKVSCTLLEGYVGEFTEDLFKAYIASYDHLRLRRRSGKDQKESITPNFLKHKFYIKHRKADILKNQYILEKESELKFGRIDFKGYRELYKLSGLSKKKVLNPQFGRTATNTVIPDEPPIDGWDDAPLSAPLVNLGNSTTASYTYTISGTGIYTVPSGSNYTFYSQTELSDQQYLKAQMPYGTNIIKQLQILKKALDIEVFRNTESYDDYVIPSHWLEAKKIKKEALIIKKEDEVIVYNWAETQISARRECINIGTLKRFHGVIIYGYEEDEFLLDNFTKLFRRSKYNTHKDVGRLVNSLAVKIFKTAKKNGKEFRSNLPNSVHVTRFINNNKVFKHFATTLLMLKEKQKYNLQKLEDTSTLSFVGLLQHIYPEKYNDINEIDKYIRDYGRTLDDLDGDFVESIITVALQHNLVDEDVYNKFKSIDTYVDRTELLNSTQFSFESVPYVVDYLVLKKKKVSDIWIKPKQYEIDLIKDSIAKLEYQLKTNDKSIRVQRGFNLSDRYRSEDRFSSTKLTQELKLQQSLLTYYKYTNYGITKEN